MDSVAASEKKFYFVSIVFQQSGNKVDKSGERETWNQEFSVRGGKKGFLYSTFCEFVFFIYETTKYRWHETSWNVLFIRQGLKPR